MRSSTRRRSPPRRSENVSLVGKDRLHPIKTRSYRSEQLQGPLDLQPPGRIGAGRSAEVGRRAAGGWVNPRTEPLRASITVRVGVPLRVHPDGPHPWRTHHAPGGPNTSGGPRHRKDPAWRCRAQSFRPNHVHYKYTKIDPPVVKRNRNAGVTPHSLTISLWS